MDPLSRPKNTSCYISGLAQVVLICNNPNQTISCQAAPNNSVTALALKTTASATHLTSSTVRPISSNTQIVSTELAQTTQGFTYPTPYINTLSCGGNAPLGRGQSLPSVGYWNIWIPESYFPLKCDYRQNLTLWTRTVLPFPASEIKFNILVIFADWGSFYPEDYLNYMSQSIGVYVQGDFAGMGVATYHPSVFADVPSDLSSCVGVDYQMTGIHADLRRQANHQLLCLPTANGAIGACHYMGTPEQLVYLKEHSWFRSVLYDWLQPTERPYYNNVQYSAELNPVTATKCVCTKHPIGAVCVQVDSDLFCVDPLGIVSTPTAVYQGTITSMLLSGGSFCVAGESFNVQVNCFQAPNGEFILDGTTYPTLQHALYRLTAEPGTLLSLTGPRNLMDFPAPAASKLVTLGACCITPGGDQACYCYEY